MTTLIRRLPGAVSGPNAALLNRWIPELPFTPLRRFSALLVTDKADQIVASVPNLGSTGSPLGVRSGQTGAYCRLAGGIPHLEFNNGRTTDVMETPADFDLADGAAFTAYGLIRMVDGPGAGIRRIVLGVAPEGGNQGVQIYGASNVLTLYRGGTPFDSSIVLPLNTWATYVAVFNGAASVARINASEATGTAGTGAISAAKLSIGKTAGSTSTPHRVDVRETGIIAGALDATQRAQLISALASIYV